MLERAEFQRSGFNPSEPVGFLFICSNAGGGADKAIPGDWKPCIGAISKRNVLPGKNSFTGTGNIKISKQDENFDRLKGVIA